MATRIFTNDYYWIDTTGIGTKHDKRGKGQFPIIIYTLLSLKCVKQTTNPFDVRHSLYYYDDCKANI